MIQLQTSGKRYSSSHDCVRLVNGLIQQNRTLEREYIKRLTTLDCPPRVHQLAVAVLTIQQRHNTGNRYHFENEEMYLEEFGRFLIQRYAAITKTNGGTWVFDRTTLRETSILTK